MPENQSPLDIQPAQSSDFELLLALVQDYHQEAQLPFDSTITGKALRTLMENESAGSAWLLRSGEALAGYILMSRVHSMELGGSCFLFDEVFVRPEHRNQGFGKRAAEALITRYQAEGIRALFLEVDPNDDAAFRFYRRLGFKSRPFVTQVLVLQQETTFATNRASKRLD